MSTTKHPLEKYREDRPDSPSREKLASELGVSWLTVRRWETGEALPQERHRPIIFKVTGIRFTDFVEFHENNDGVAA